MSIDSLTNALKTLLEAPNAGGTVVHVFVGEASDVPTDGDGAAHAYIVLTPTPGLEDTTEEDLQSSPGVLEWTCQATCAGGDYTRALRALERVQSAAVGKQLTSSSGFIRKSGNLGGLRKDLTISPNRWYAPIDLVVTV